MARVIKVMELIEFVERHDKTNGETESASKEKAIDKMKKRYQTNPDICRFLAISVKLLFSFFLHC